MLFRSSINTFTSYSSSDYNGFRPNRGVEASFEWNTPKTGATDFTDPDHQAALQPGKFRTLAEYSKATGQDGHSVLVDYDIFMKVPKLDAKDLTAIQKVYKAEDFDFRLKAGAAAIDKGVALANVNEGFSGRAPDLGALETGRPVPHFGPRP